MTKRADGLFAQARRMMEEEEIPPRVSNRLLWAAVSELYIEQRKTNGVVGDVKWIKWAIRLVVTGLVGLAFKVLI